MIPKSWLDDPILGIKIPIIICQYILRGLRINSVPSEVETWRYIKAKFTIKRTEIETYEKAEYFTINDYCRYIVENMLKYHTICPQNGQWYNLLVALLKRDRSDIFFEYYIQNSYNGDRYILRCQLLEHDDEMFERIRLENNLTNQRQLRKMYRCLAGHNPVKFLDIDVQNQWFEIIV